MIDVVAAALIGPDNKVLMHQRPLAKMHGGLWEFPGGKLEPGETQLAALARELVEELDIAIDCDSALPVAFAQDPALGVQITLWTLSTWQRAPRCVEGEAIAWVALPELLDLAMPPLDVPLANALIAAITGLPSGNDPHMSATPTRP